MHPTTPLPKLTRAQITAAAFELLETTGLDALSMRGLAAGLQVKAPALYWHVSSKAELLGMMATEIYAEARRSVPTGDSWRDWLVGFGETLHFTFRRYRDGAKLCALAKPLAVGPDAAQRIADPLLRFGLSLDQSIRVQASVISLTIGWAMFEENGPMYEFLEVLMDTGQAYSMGLRALVAGYELGENLPTINHDGFNG